MEPIVILIGVLFAAASIILVRSKFERVVGVFFVLRSNWGIKLIDSVAKRKPRYGVHSRLFHTPVFRRRGSVLPFSQQGDPGQLLQGVPAVGAIISAAAAYLGRYELAIGFPLLIVLMAYLMSRIRSPIVDTALTAVVYCLGFAIGLRPKISVLFGIFGLPAVMVYVMFTPRFEHPACQD